MFTGTADISVRFHNGNGRLTTSLDVGHQTLVSYWPGVRICNPEVKKYAPLRALSNSALAA